MSRDLELVEGCSMTGETLLQQRQRTLLYVQGRNALHFLHLAWGTLATESRNDAALLTGALYRRVCRVSGDVTLGMDDLKRFLDSEIELSRTGSPLNAFAWLTRELEMCLARFPAQLTKYLRQQGGLLDAELRAALALHAFSSAKTHSDRSDLLSYIAELRTGGLSISSPTPSPATPSPFVTQAQQRALDRLVALGEVFFSIRAKGGIKPRLFPLILGPTGTGKTHIGQAAAKILGAHPVIVTSGDWVPLGANADYEATTYAILAALAANNRVVLIIDEIDKFRPDFEATWSRSVASDIWRTLDGFLPVESFAKSSRSNLVENHITAEDLSEKISTSLWIVACGTWQQLWEPKRSMGFKTSAQPARVDFTDLRVSQTIPAELLLRFHPRAIAIPYPSPQETESIFRNSGLSEAAGQVGLELDSASHDWTCGGFRSVEALWAEIALLSRENEKRTNIERTN